MNEPNPVWIQNLIFYSKYPVPLNHLGYPTAHYQSFLNRKISHLEERVMSRKNSSAPANKNSWEVTFVQIRLTGEHKDGFEKWSSRKDTDVALDVATFMSNGNKTSITWDDANKCWIVSATCKEESSKNYNHCLSSRSDDWYEAMKMNVYKNDVICNKGSWLDQQQDSNWG